jgi:hypothetical protein
MAQMGYRHIIPLAHTRGSLATTKGTKSHPPGSVATQPGSQISN